MTPPSMDVDKGENKGIDKDAGKGEDKGIDKDVDRVPEPVASYISQSEKRLSDLTRQQFRFVALVALLPTIVLVLALVVIPYAMRAPTNVELLDRLSDSNEQLSDLAQTLLQSAPSVTTTNLALEAVVLQSDLHKEAIEDLREAQKQPSAETQTIIQVIGSAAILALLGALGLQRLQNIDTEINNVRESVFSQAEARAETIQKALQSQVDDQVQKQVEAQYKKTRSAIGELVEESLQVWGNAQQQSDEMLSQAREQVESVKGEVAKIQGVLAEYPWLKDRKAFDIASQIKHLVSVEQAQTLAERFRRAGDIISAREALKVIVDKKLPGSSNEFHNAHSEAMRMEDYPLALEIVDLGLSCSPDQFDLIADKTKVLISLGRADEARELIEDWRERKPNEFARSWRPVVFYEDLYDSLELTPEALEELDSAFREVTQKLPNEIKPWAEYADLMSKQSRLDEAESILHRALEINPLSQQLNFVLGDLLLKQGRGEEALEYLEKALRFDYQDQYQHDVNQYAVRARLAQAYEAVGSLGKARLLYRSVVDAAHPYAFPAIKEYARNRIEAIALIEGALPEQQGGEPSPEELINFLNMIRNMASDEDKDKDDLSRDIDITDS